jgi:glycosyltransferase involved in cell wall biosynthesis
MNESSKNKSSNPDISIILPCLNEREALALCLADIQKVLQKEQLDAEIILVDNGSTDGSLEIAEKAQKNIPHLVVLTEPRRGYGSAYMRGLREAHGNYFFMADADHSYDFAEIPHFIERLKNGADLVVGNRFKGSIAKDAMPLHHRYLGNPLLSFLVKKLFGVRIGDIHCGMRAIRRDAYEKIILHTTGMEFASEMIVQAAKQGLQVEEIGIDYRQRIGESKLESFGDGWRHLRFILLYSPMYLFFIPGAALFGIGFISLTVLYFGTFTLFGIQFYVHPMFLSAVLVMLGYQIILFAGFSRIYAITHLGETDRRVQSLFNKITLERAGITGLTVTLVGGCLYLLIFLKWIHSGFGSLNEIKNSIVALTAVVVGMQTLFSAFMLSTLGIKER